MKTVVSRRGQVVIPKELREKLGLRMGTVLRVWTEGKRVILEPVSEPPREIFVRAGGEVTDKIIREAKALGDKAERLLKDLGVQDG